MFKSKKYAAKKYWMKSFVFICPFVLLFVSAFLLAQTNSSSGATLEFAQANDFPRGALVYAQFQNLPALVKLWDESELKQNYLKSQNFTEFRNRHLALKLISRWQEFNDALGFELNATKIVDTTDARAAVAVYDIGKLELVFIAPLSNEKLVVALGFWNQSEFEENELPDKTIYYSREVEADRGRQQQKIVFAFLKGRFVLATSEKLLLETIANINSKAKKNRLSDDPDFVSLAAKTSSHSATIWVNQARLNEDWYFKRYWVMRNITELKNIRAGMFDFEMTDEKFVERRVFLSNENRSPAKSNFPAAEAERLQTMIPVDAAFFKIQSVEGNPALAANLIVETLLDKSLPKIEQKRSPRWNSYDRFRTDNSSDYYNYSFPNSNLDENIDDEETENEIVSTPDSTRIKRAAEFKRIMVAAGASSAVTISDPQVLENPLFAEFRRAVIFTLRTPANFDQAEFENSVSEIVQNRIGVNTANLNLVWANKSIWRQMDLPALGWHLSYARRNNELIIANNMNLLESVLNEKSAKAIQAAAKFNELTMIRLNRRKNAFDDVMQKIEPKKIANDDANNQKPIADSANNFFSGNINSLLDTVSDVGQIEIKKNNDGNYLTEEISFVLK